MAKNRKYPVEMESYIRDNVIEKNDEELAEDVTRIFGVEDVTAKKIKEYRKRHKISSAGREKSKYSKEMYEFVKANIKGTSSQVMTDMVNQQFGEGTVTLQQMRTYIKNRHLHSGINCQFKKKHTPYNKGKHTKTVGRMAEIQYKKVSKPHNRLPIGTICETTEGYKIIKVQEKGTQWQRWKMLHRYNWEQAYGEIPKGKLIIFLDGDKSNCDVSNLRLIDKAANQLLNRKGMRSESAEITNVAVTICELHNTIKGREAN